MCDICDRERQRQNREYYERLAEQKQAQRVQDEVDSHSFWVTSVLSAQGDTRGYENAMRERYGRCIYCGRSEDRCIC